MCGIVGKISRDKSPVDVEQIRSARDLLVRRGPDDAGEWVEDNVGLGHRRLSILDISSAGHQPMSSSDGRYVIVFNGEIYNFQELRKRLNGVAWHSSSDTETILECYKQWGVKCLELFHGMFAFAIWDRREKTIFAARDRMGVKPFYYSLTPRSFVFSSRPSPLFTLEPGLSKEIDEQGLRFYLEIGYIPAPFSIFTQIKKLPPAHYLIFDQQGLRIERYWDYRHIPVEKSWVDRNEEDLLDQLDGILKKSVQLRMVSDVPLGAFLSGGIDSSLIVALMTRLSSQRVKTFTIGFDEKDHDESCHAEKVAKYLGTEHYCQHLRVNDLLKLMDTFGEEYDEPFFDHSAFPVMAVSRMTRQYVKVSLSGDGGDELFGGYHYYWLVQKLNPMFCLPYGLRKACGALLKLFPNHSLRLIAGALNQSDASKLFAYARSISKDFHGAMNSDVVRQTQSIRDLFRQASVVFPKGLRPAEEAMRLDTFYTLPDDYLQKVDVASMAFSLESREPLLDQDVVEWAMKLPWAYKWRGGQNKYLLRKLAYRYVPSEILDRPKRGFGVPMENWLKNELSAWADERFEDAGLFKGLPLDRNNILKLWKQHKTGAINAHPLLWAILVFLNFYKKASTY
jgi:asparagine synthase (glutamine-hydrolysing)